MGKMYLNGILYGIENRFRYDLLFENTNFTPDTSGNSKERSYTLRKSIDEYDAVVVFGWLNVSATAKDQLGSMLIMNQDFYARALSDTSKWVFLLNGSQGSGNRRLVFRFADSTTIETLASKSNTNEEPRLWKIYGLKFPSDDENTRYSEIPIYLGSQLLYKDRISTNSTSKTDFFCDNYYNGTADHLSKITAHVVVPSGYEIKYRISALLNSQSTNKAQIYINEVLLISGGTYIGGESANPYLGHFGEIQMSDLFGFSDIPVETRYINPTTQTQGYNFSIASSVNGQTAWAENVTIHAYLVKTYWH